MNLPRKVPRRGGDSRPACGMFGMTLGVSIMLVCFLISVNVTLSHRRPSVAPTKRSAQPISSVVSPVPTIAKPSEQVSEQVLRSQDDFKEFPFVRLQEVSTRQWLSRTIDTNVEHSLPHEKIFLFYFVKKYQAWAVQGHTRMHLTCELNDRVTVDRKWARSFEMWSPSFDHDGFLFLKSRRNGKYLRVVGTDQLMADMADARQAARFRVVAAREGGRCHAIGEGADASLPRKSQIVVAGDACWGVSNGTALTGSELVEGGPRPNFILFGSPKPLSKLAAKDANDPFDTFIISRRTLQNWATLPNMIPFIIADDHGNGQLIDMLNADGTTLQSIALQTDSFERKSHYNNQPTYRGLFDAALKKYPSAQAVMYSNSDILYSPSLADTIQAVVKYVEAEKLRKTRPGMPPYKVKGWMIVGQRVNHDVPSDWEASQQKNPHWAENLTSFAKDGDLFESDAEDYFIVSRSLFDWMKEIPDFIVGGVAFDNWVTNKVNKMAEVGEAICIDGGKTIVAVHQNHGGDPKESHKSPKSYYNSHLAVQHGGWTLGHTADAAYATDRTVEGVITVYDKHRLLYG